MADTAQLEQLSNFCQSLSPSGPGNNGSTASTKLEPPAPPHTANENASFAASPIPVVEINQSASGGCPPPPQNGGLTPLEQILDARKIDLANPPPCPVPIFNLGLHQICTEGNLTGISSQAKAGKSAVVGAMIASALSDDPDIDTFGFSSPAQRSGAIIHFDCEQSPYDAYEGVKKLLHRAGMTQLPCRLFSYSLADVSTKRRRELLRTAMQVATNSVCSIHSVFLDGVADLCVDPNDPAEAFQLIEELHCLAIHFKTAIVLVLHENPGGLGSGKTRGHLGSQLERKAESNLRLQKAEDGVTEIFGGMCRHAHIPRGFGRRFKYDVESAMHVSCEAAAIEKGREDRESMVAIAGEAFAEATSLKYGVLKEAIMKIRHVKSGAAENWLKKMVDAKVINKNELGHYIKST